MELKTISFNQIPNKIKIFEFVDLIRDYFFPNYFNQVCDLLILERTCHFYFQNYISSDQIKEKIFFDQIKKVYHSLLCDLEMAYESDPSCNSIEEVLITYPGFEALMTYRISNLIYRLDLKLIARIISERAHSKTGIDIHPGATIGDYFFIDHGTGVVIGETTIIGHHVKIYQGVTLGAISLSKGQLIKGKKRHPTISNYVTIYSGASILGGETFIGENTIIGSNVFITKSIEGNKKVINQEAEIILKDKK